MNQNHAERHIWEFRWVRDLIILSIIALIILAAYTARSVVAPTLFGLVFAYVFNPVVAWASQWRNIGRTRATSALMGTVVLIVFIIALLLTPLLVTQIDRLLGNLQHYAAWTTQQIETHARPYLEQVADRINQTEPGTIATTEPTTHTSTPLLPTLTAPSSTPAPPNMGQRLANRAENVDLSMISSVILTVANRTISFISSALGATTYFILFLIVAAFSFFFFSCKLERIIAWGTSLVPQKNRTRTLKIITRMDNTIAAFIRGRLIQSLSMGIVLSLGWGIVGVPYWLALGLLGGLLNLAPFLASLAWIAAVLLTSIDQLANPNPLTPSGFNGWGHLMIWAVLLPSVIYILGQMLDGWVIEPLVQGSATNLDPLTVLLAVLIGGTLAGMLGLIVAIPLAACIKILAAEIILPAYRQWAHQQP